MMTVENNIHYNCVRAHMTLRDSLSRVDYHFRSVGTSRLLMHFFQVEITTQQIH